MSYSINMREQFMVKRTVEDCFNYVADFSTLEEWDHTVTASKKVSNGSIGLGTNFEVWLKMGLSKVYMKYEIMEFEYPFKIVLKGKAKTFTAIDTVTFKEERKFSKIDWNATVTFEGTLSKLVSNFETRIIQNGKKTIEGLRLALENDFEAPAEKFKRRDAFVLPGVALFAKGGFQKAKKHWNPVSENIRDRHIVITGATSGIGLAVAFRLAHKHASLTIVARNKTKANQVRKQIIEATGNENINIEIADMSLIREVKNLAQRMIDNGTKIDVLINNAGALFNPRQETEEGIEKSFALLLLGPYAFTKMLIPLLEKSNNGRVINVSSGGMYTQPLQLSDIESKKGKYSGSIAYARAKRGLVSITNYWATEYPNIAFNSMHPGWVDTQGVVDALPTFYKLMKNVLRTPEQGADTIVWLAAAKEAGKVSGKFWLDRIPHTMNLFSKTKIKDGQQMALIQILENYTSVIQKDNL